MQEFVFEEEIVAVVRVRAESETSAREVAFSALGSPSSLEIELANQAKFVTGEQATITEVNFSIDGPAKLLPEKATG
jgi:hypothetical protein